MALCQPLNWQSFPSYCAADKIVHLRSLVIGQNKQKSINLKSILELGNRYEVDIFCELTLG